MEFSFERQGDRLQLRLSGRLTFADAPRFPKVLDGLGDGLSACEVDLGSLDAIDSTGLSLFVHIYDLARAKSFAFSLRNARGSVRDALLRAGFDELVPVA